LDKLLEYKRSWIKHVNRMPRNRLPRVIKHYSPTGRRNHGRPLRILLDTWDRNVLTSDPTPWKIYWWWWTSCLLSKNTNINLLAPELFFFILAHPVYKMWTIKEPNKLELWNKLHFEGGKKECIPCLKYSVPIFVE